MWAVLSLFCLPTFHKLYNYNKLSVSYKNLHRAQFSHDKPKALEDSCMKSYPYPFLCSNNFKWNQIEQLRDVSSQL